MSIRRSLGWMMLSQGGYFILQFSSSVILARLLTPYEVGVYTAGAAMVGFLSVLQAFGLTLLVVREPEIDRHLSASLFTMNAVIAVILSVAIIALSAFGGAFLHEAGVQRVMLVLALLPLIGILEFLPAANLERNGEFRTIAVINLLRAVAMTGTTVGLALAGLSYMSYPLGAVAASVVGAAGIMIAGRRYVSFKFGLTAWPKIVRFGLQQLSIQGVPALSLRASEFLLGRLLGLSALGLYGRAANLSNMIWANIHLVIARVVMVDLANRKRQGLGIREAYLRTIEMVTALLWPCFAGLGLLAGPLIRTIYGERWVAAAPPLAALSVAGILYVAISMTWELFVICNETGRQARFECLRSPVGLVMFVGGALISLTAAAIGRIGEAIFTITLYRPHIERMTSTTLADFIPIYRRSAFLTVAACAPALALMLIYNWSPETPFPLVIVAIAVGFAAWLAAIRLTGHVIAGEVFRLLKRGRALVGAAANGWTG
jgi:O-antigen/teichoic acid export membrane protein